MKTLLLKLREYALFIVSFIVAAFIIYVYLDIYTPASAGTRPSITTGIFMLLVVFVTTLQGAFKDVSDRQVVKEKRKRDLWNDRLKAYRAFGQMLNWFDQNNQGTHSFWTTTRQSRRADDFNRPDKIDASYMVFKNQIFNDVSSSLDMLTFIFEKDMVEYLTALYKETHRVQRECDPTDPESLVLYKSSIVKFNNEYNEGRFDSPFVKRFKKYLDRND